MEYIIREAKEQDFEKLTQVFDEVDLLHAEALPQIFKKSDEPFRSREYISGIISNENSTILVAEADDQIIGLIVIEIRESADLPMMVKRRYANVSTIVVAETMRHSGIGKELMKRAETWAMDKGISQIELNVWDFNRNAVGFFDNMGYSPSRHTMWKEVRDPQTYQ